MAYEEGVADRVRREFLKIDGVTEKKMFGGIAFMVHGNMCCGVIDDRLMVRVGPEAYKASLTKPNVHEMDFTGRPLKGFLYVEPAGFKSVKDLRYWINNAVKYVITLPRK